LEEIDKKKVIQEFLEFLEKKFQISSEEIIKQVREKEVYEIPISIFDNKELSALETICKYLKENLGLTFSRIAELTNRDQRVIGKTYHNSENKLSKPFAIKKTAFYIPLSIFRDKSLGVLETLVYYLKEEKQLTFHKIALLLNRDDRTIWTTYHRAVKKRGDRK